jgi:hypothetical protein
VTRPVTERCSCGCKYDDFSTGLNFATVRQMMRQGEEADPSTWRNKGRRGVLGFWRELKLQLWAGHVNECSTPSLADCPF